VSFARKRTGAVETVEAGRSRWVAAPAPVFDTSSNGRMRSLLIPVARGQMQRWGGPRGLVVR